MFFISFEKYTFFNKFNFFPQVENNNVILAHNRKLPCQILYLYDINIESSQSHILLTRNNITENIMVYHL